MFEVSHSSKNHRNIILVGRINRILIMDRSARLNDCGDASFGSSLNTISEREEGIGCHHAPRLDEWHFPMPRFCLLVLDQLPWYICLLQSQLH